MMRNRVRFLLGLAMTAGLLGQAGLFPVEAEVRRARPRAAPPKWGPDRRLTFDPGASETTFNFAHSVAADDSGRVHVVWYDTRGGHSQVYYKRSLNGGKSWEPDMRLSTGRGLSEHPSVAASGSNVYVVWHGMDTEPKPNVWLRRSTDGGKSWEEGVQLTHSNAAAHASVAVVGSLVHLIWKSPLDGETEVYYQRSTDAGRTWSTAQRLTDAPDVSYVPSLGVSDELVVLAWVDTRDGNEEEYIKISTDGGLNWGPDTRITDNRMNSWAPSVAVSGNTIHLVWFDQKANPFHAYDAEKKLDEAMRLLKLRPKPAPQGVHVADPEQTAKWRATRKMERIRQEAPTWVSRGGDRARLQAILKELEAIGKPISLLAAAERKLDQALALVDQKSETAPQQSHEADDVQALQKRLQSKVARIQHRAPLWVQSGGDANRLQQLMQQFQQAMQSAEQVSSYTQKEKKLDEALKLMEISFDPGTPKDAGKVFYADALQVRVRRKQQQIQAAAPAWVEQGGNPKQLEALLKGFHRRMQLAMQEWDIYYRRSDDGGKTWSDEMRLTDAAGPSQRPNLAVEKNHLYIVWFDDRDDNMDVYFKESSDGGHTWSADTRLTNAPGESMRPMVAVSGGGVHVVWFDRRDGNSEIYYKSRRGDSPDGE